MKCIDCSIDLPESMMDEKGRCPGCKAQYHTYKHRFKVGELTNIPVKFLAELKLDQKNEAIEKAPQRTGNIEAAITFKAQAEHRKTQIDAIDDSEIEKLKQQELEEHQTEEDRQKKAYELSQIELARRALAKKHLLPFVKYMEHDYEAGWVHKDICRRLERFSKQVANRESPRLMLFMPPRHGKSTLASQNFPAWHLGHHPEHDIITASYSASLAMDFSKMVRDKAASPKYRNIFPGKGLDPDNKNAEGWKTKHGGVYVPAGVGGPMTGRGAHILVIDDPVKNREEAESETTRNTIKNWYTSTAYTRLAPGGGVLVILTRWHEDDLAGWLLSQADQGADQWEVVRYPAIAEQDEEHRKTGEALHPARYPLPALQQIKKAVGRRDWRALYQQDPIGEEGDYFSAKDLKFYTRDERPPLDELAIYAAWDLAIGTKEHNDFSVGLVAGIDRQLNLWLLDAYRGRWTSLEIVENLFACYDRWRPAITGIERTHVEQAIGPLLTEQKRAQRKLAFRIEPLKPGRRDKRSRAAPIRGLMEMGRVYLPREKEWADDLVDELLKFPNGKHDDQVDAIAWLGQMIEMYNPRPLVAAPKPKSWKDKLSKYVTNSGDGRSYMAS